MVPLQKLLRDFRRRPSFPLLRMTSQTGSGKRLTNKKIKEVNPDVQHEKLLTLIRMAGGVYDSRN
jgi:hypothetical protein